MADTYRKEKIKIEVLNRREEKEHFHQDIELLHVLEGKLLVRVGTQRVEMQPGDIFLVNAEKSHGLEGSEDVLYMKLSIEYDLVSDIMNSYDIMFWCDSTDSTDSAYDELRELMRMLLGKYLSNKGGVNNFAHISLCYRIMDFLMTHFVMRNSDPSTHTEGDKYQKRIDMINNYIRANYDKRISLKDLSEQLYLSNGYLSRFFKKNYHMSFAEYLTKIRLYHAVDELLYSDIPITRIAYDNGFASVAVFNRAFREEYGETPSAVRKRAENKGPAMSEEQEKIIDERLTNYLWHDGRNQTNREHAAAETAHVDTTIREELRPVWNQTINVGAAQDLLRSDVQAHVIILKEGIGFQYARIWSPFSREMLFDVNQPDENYNFSRLDTVLDFLVTTGLKPFIELWPKPRRVQRNVKAPLVFEPVQLPENQETWGAVLEAFMRHILQRYKHEEVAGWRFELWMDDLMMVDRKEVDVHLQAFRQTYRIIKSYSPESEVGGFGLHGYIQAADAKSSFVQKFYRRHLEYAARDQVVPDFISVYCYMYDTVLTENGFMSRRATDPRFLIHAMDNVKRDLKAAGLDGCKLYITEWNLTVSDRNYINDTCYKGAFILKNYLYAYAQVDEMAYFIGSDRVAEYYDTDRLLFGGSGLIARDGILKPAAYAFEFLNRQYRYYIAQGEHYMVTTDGRGNYGVLCHNCKELNYNYYYIEEDEIEKEHIRKYFEDTDPLLLQITLTGIEDGSYQLKANRVNEENGSILGLWSQMDFEQELTRNDIKYFRRVCEPNLTISNVESTHGEALLELTLEPNEIAFVRLLKRDRVTRIH
ncbi:MAG: GH39 family glycosyl hydrolase [Eubacterium sp.]